MTKISLDEVKHIAKLAKLTLSEKETEKYQDQLSEVIGYVSQLNEVDTKQTDPTSQTTGLLNVIRSDEPNNENILNQEQALSGSEKTHNGYFVVPATLEERTDK